MIVTPTPSESNMSSSNIYHSMKLYCVMADYFRHENLDYTRENAYKFSLSKLLVN